MPILLMRSPRMSEAVIDTASAMLFERAHISLALPAIFLKSDSKFLSISFLALSEDSPALLFGELLDLDLDVVPGLAGRLAADLVFSIAGLDIERVLAIGVFLVGGSELELDHGAHGDTVLDPVLVLEVDEHQLFSFSANMELRILPRLFMPLSRSLTNLSVSVIWTTSPNTGIPKWVPRACKTTFGSGSDSSRLTTSSLV